MLVSSCRTVERFRSYIVVVCKPGLPAQAAQKGLRTAGNKEVVMRAKAAAKQGADTIPDYILYDDRGDSAHFLSSCVNGDKLVTITCSLNTITGS